MATQENANRAGSWSLEDIIDVIKKTFSPAPANRALNKCPYSKDDRSNQKEATQNTAKPPQLHGSNAILSDYQPTGTKTGGAEESKKLALEDAKHMNQGLKDNFNAIGTKYDLPPALLAGIASRESGMGTGLDEDGNGDNGNAFGIMQVDRNANSEISGEDDPNGYDHIDQAAQILNGKLALVKKYHPKWPPERQLQRAVAIYNGDASGQTPTLDNVDQGTTGGDYSNDVWARSQEFASHW